MSIATMTRPEKYRYLDEEVLPALRRYIMDRRASYRGIATQLRTHGCKATYERVRQWVEGEGFPGTKNADALVRFLRAEGVL